MNASDIEAWITVTTPSGLILGRAAVPPSDAISLIGLGEDLQVGVARGGFIVTEGKSTWSRHYVVPFDIGGQVRLGPNDLRVTVQVTARSPAHSAVHKPHNDVLNVAHG